MQTIFAESGVNPRLAEAVAAETGATISDDPIYADSLGPPGSGADTLDGMLLHDARVLHDGLLEAEAGFCLAGASLASDLTVNIFASQVEEFRDGFRCGEH